MRLGAHVSVAGGLARGPEQGAAIGAEVIQIFTRNQRTWRHRPVDDEEAVQFRAAVRRHRIGCVMSHASYLINLAAPRAPARRRSVAAFRAELLRCAKLGVQLLNFHPGAHLGAGEAAGVARVVESLREILETTPDTERVRLVVENTAGQGSCIGHRFEHLADILAGVDAPRRTGVCLDTAHTFAAGYELRNEEGWEETFGELRRAVGRRPLVALHLNDSRVGRGTRVDRHANLGRGRIGAGLFRRLVVDSRLRRLPGFLETPGGPTAWRRELARLRRTARAVGR